MIKNDVKPFFVIGNEVTIIFLTLSTLFGLKAFIYRFSSKKGECQKTLPFDILTGMLTLIAIAEI